MSLALIRVDNVSKHGKSISVRLLIFEWVGPFGAPFVTKNEIQHFEKLPFGCEFYLGTL